MDKIETTCPKCGCPHWHSNGYSTADGYSAWKDSDGTWYNGPARQSMKHECAACGWSQQIERRRGKLESVTSDPRP